MIKLTREIVDRRLVVDIVAATTQMTDTDSERTSADVPSVETVGAEKNTKNSTSNSVHYRHTLNQLRTPVNRE